MGPLELLLIVVLALIVFGPARLPEIMGQVGKAIADFRRATSELSDEFNRTIQAELQETRSVVSETRNVVTDVHSTVNSAMTGTPPAPTRIAGPDEAPVAAASLAGSEVYSSPHVESNGVSNGTTATNGTDGATATGASGPANGVHTEPPRSTPPLADTSQWSWETAAPPPPPSPKTSPEQRPSELEPPY